MKLNFIIKMFILSFMVLGTLNQNLRSQPAPFQNQVVIPENIMEAPVTMRFIPDGTGRAIVLSKNGYLYITPDLTQGGSAVVGNYMTITDINTTAERGLYDIAFDPNFSVNNYFYLIYCKNSTSKWRVSRFEHHEHNGGIGSEGHLNTEVMIWEDNEVFKNSWHYGAAIDIGPDNLLYITTGDEQVPTNAQDMAKADGKVHRIALNGSIPADNPYYDGSPGLYNTTPGPHFGFLQSVYAAGLRNPFRGRFDKPTNRFFISEVGASSGAMEDLHLVIPGQNAGANFGWPYCNGGPCNDPNYTDPIHYYPRNVGKCIIGGVVYRGGSFPSEYVGRYFYADFEFGWVNYLEFDGSGNVNANVPFITGPAANRVISFDVGPDGALYYISDFNQTNTTSREARIRRVFWDGNQAPACSSVSATPSNGSNPPLTVNFDAVVSDQEGDDLSYSWDFGDGSAPASGGPLTPNGNGTVTLPTISHTYTQKGIYAAALSISDDTHTNVCHTLTITVGTPPTVNITSPAEGSTFSAQQTISFTGNATDANGNPITGTDLKWEVNFNHNNHTHPLVSGVTGNSGSFDAFMGHSYQENTSVSISLSATDSDGLLGSNTVTIFPNKVDYTFGSNPPGMTIYIENTPTLTPLTIDEIINFQYDVFAPTTQCVNGQEFQFMGWSDGGAQTHTATVPATNSTLTANYQLLGSCNNCGTALNFDGIDDYVETPEISLSGDFTIEAWVYFEAGATIDNKDGILSNRAQNTDINFYGGKGRIYTGNDEIIANTALTDGEWNHIAFTRNNGKLDIYVNGALDASVISGWTTAFEVGKLGTTKAGKLQGQLDEVRIWSVARTANEIATFYHQSLTGSLPGLLASYTFDDPHSSQTAVDHSLNGNDGIMGATTAAGTDDPAHIISTGPMQLLCGSPSGPLLTITYPTDGAIVSSVDFAVNWTADYTHTGDEVELILDSNPPLKVDATAGTHTFTGVSEAPHTVYARVLDNSGSPYANATSKDTVSFIVDTSVPINCGTALEFDGNDQVEVPNMLLTGDFTLEAWIYFEPNTIIDNHDGILSNEGRSSDINFYQGLARIYIGHDVLKANTPLTHGIWYHVAFVRSGDQLTYYINGVSDATASGWTGDFEVARFGVTKKGYLTGALDEIRIWNIARSASDIYTYHDKQLGGIPPGLIALYNFDEDTGVQLVQDQSSNGNGSLGADINPADDDPARIATTGPMQFACGPLPDPELAFTHPAEGAFVYGGVTASWNIAFGSAGDQLELTLDNDPPILVPAAQGSYTFTSLGETSHTLYGRLLDSASNAYSNGESRDTVSFTVDNSIPVNCGTALKFDGNDEVEIPNILLTGDFTIEAWIYFEPNTALDNRDGILSNESRTNDINFYQGLARIYVGYDVLKGVTPLTNGNWYHLAFVRSGNQTVYYINGAEDVSSSGWTGNFEVARLGVTKKGYLTGALDEVRIWNIARSAAEIQTYAHQHLEASPAGLIALYSFDEDAGDQLVMDYGSNGIGSLGADFNIGNDDPERFLTSGPMLYACGPPPDPQFSFTSPENGATMTNVHVTLSWTEAFANPGDQLELILDNNSTVVVDALLGSYTFSGLSEADHTVYGTILDSTNLEYSNSESRDTVTFSVNTSIPANCGMVLEFDGNDELEIPNISLTDDFTVEAWIYFEPGQNIDNRDGIFSNEARTSDINFYAGLARIYTGSDQLVGATPLTSGQWYHLAFVREGTQLSYYINGALDVSVDPGWSGTFEAARLGVTKKGRLQGALDEVRIWTVARTASEIQSNYDEAMGAQPGLVLAYHFDEAPDDQNVLDYSGNGNHGSLGLGLNAGTDDPIRLFDIELVNATNLCGGAGNQAFGSRTSSPGTYDLGASNVLGGFTLGPNPTSDHIFIRNVEGVRARPHIIIADVTGRVLMQEQWDAGKFPEYRLDIDKLPAGLYFYLLDYKLSRKSGRIQLIK